MLTKSHIHLVSSNLSIITNQSISFLSLTDRVSKSESQNQRGKQIANTSHKVLRYKMGAQNKRSFVTLL